MQSSKDSLSMSPSLQMTNCKMIMFERFKQSSALCFLPNVNLQFRSYSTNWLLRSQNTRLKKKLCKGRFESFRLSPLLQTSEIQWFQRRFWLIISKKQSSSSKSTIISEKRIRVCFKKERHETNITFRRLKNFRRK